MRTLVCRTRKDFEEVERRREAELGSSTYSGESVASVAPRDDDDAMELTVDNYSVGIRFVYRVTGYYTSATPA